VPRGQATKKRRWVPAVAVALIALATCLGALGWSLPDVRPLARRAPRTTAFVDLRRQEAAAEGRKLDVRWMWRPLARISPFLREAVVLSEDARFFEHEGVDWDALEHAAERNWKRGRVAMGGSTITQQVAKNLYLSPSKNPLRKLRELLISRRLEAELSKERILEIYLNVAEWGDGVFGAEAAAQRWFGVPASELGPVEAARLAIALPNPRLRAPSVNTRELNRRAARLVQAFWREHLIDADAFQAALAQLGVREAELS
jgi:monofunctional glycosyltransferase